MQFDELNASVCRFDCCFQPVLLVSSLYLPFAAYISGCKRLIEKNKKK